MGIASAACEAFGETFGERTPVATLRRRAIAQILGEGFEATQRVPGQGMEEQRHQRQPLQRTPERIAPAQMREFMGEHRALTRRVEAVGPRRQQDNARHHHRPCNRRQDPQFGHRHAHLARQCVRLATQGHRCRCALAQQTSTQTNQRAGLPQHPQCQHRTADDPQQQCGEHRVAGHRQCERRRAPRNDADAPAVVRPDLVRRDLVRRDVVRRDVVRCAHARSGRRLLRCRVCGAAVRRCHA